MSHYYDENQYTKSNRKDYSFRFWCFDYTFTLDNGVFSKDKIDEGTKILLDTIKEEKIGPSILDLGCGYGTIGIILKKSMPLLKVKMIDINKRAVELAKINAEKNEVDVSIMQSDGFEKITDKFDTIITNPPIRCGKKVIYNFFEQSFLYLNEGGCLYLVIRKNHGALSAQKFINSIFGNCEIINRKKGFFILKAEKNKNI